MIAQMAEPCIVSIGGGGFSEEPDNPVLDDYILSLSPESNPRVCFLPTASGDAPAYIVKFYSAFTKKECRPSHMAILQDMPRPLETFVMQQNIIYVGGGNTVAMLAAWRALGLDVLLRKAWEEGTILCGISAGSICWFEGGPTDSFGDGQLRPLTNGLAFLPGSHCPHY
jgi:dipeptidase E